MERHQFTSQIFIPFEGKRSFVAVAPPTANRPNLNDIEVFIMEGSQAVSFYRNTWHHTLIPIDGETQYIIINRGDDVDEDAKIVQLETKIIIDWQT